MGNIVRSIKDVSLSKASMLVGVYRFHEMKRKLKDLYLCLEEKGVNLSSFSTILGDLGDP